MRNRVHRQPFLGVSPRAKAEHWAARNRKRDRGVQAMYGCKEWKELRARVLARANYVCVTAGCINRATVADHVVPHRGDNALFFDPNNLQAMCKACHDRKTGTVDVGFGRRVRRLPGGAPTGGE